MRCVIFHINHSFLRPSICNRRSSISVGQQVRLYTAWTYNNGSVKQKRATTIASDRIYNTAPSVQVTYKSDFFTGGHHLFIFCPFNHGRPYRRSGFVRIFGTVRPSMHLTLFDPVKYGVSRFVLKSLFIQIKMQFRRLFMTISMNLLSSSVHGKSTLFLKVK